MLLFLIVLYLLFRLLWGKLRLFFLWIYPFKFLLFSFIFNSNFYTISLNFWNCVHRIPVVSHLFFTTIFLYALSQGLTMQSRCTWNLLCTSDWPQTHDIPPASTSQYEDDRKNLPYLAFLFYLLNDLKILVYSVIFGFLIVLKNLINFFLIQLNFRLCRFIMKTIYTSVNS